jgi:hypothetical protein
VNKAFEIMWEQAVVAQFETLSQLFMEGLMKTMKCLGLQLSGTDMNSGTLLKKSITTEHLTVVTDESKRKHFQLLCVDYNYILLLFFLPPYKF